MSGKVGSNRQSGIKDVRHVRQRVWIFWMFYRGFWTVFKSWQHGRSILQALPMCFSHLFSTLSRDLCLGAVILLESRIRNEFNLNESDHLRSWFPWSIVHMSQWCPFKEVQHFFGTSMLNLEIRGRRRDVLCCVAAHRCPSCGIHDGLIRLGHWCSGASTLFTKKLFENSDICHYSYIFVN